MSRIRTASRLGRWTLLAFITSAFLLGAGLLYGALGASAAPSCSIFWTGKASTDWGTTGNWSLTNGGTSANRLPAQSDYVCMSTAPTRGSVNLANGTSATVAGVNWPATSVSSTLSVASGGTLQIGTSSAADVSTFANVIVAGEVSTNTSVTVTSALYLVGGQLNGPGSFTFPASATLLMTGGSLTGGVQVTSSGTITVGQSALVNMNDGSLIKNFGSFSLADAANINEVFSAASILNETSGTVTYSGSASSSTAQIAANFSNFGHVTVSKGTLTLGSTATTGDTGSFNAGISGVINFSGNRSLSSGVTFPGAGQITVSGTTNIPSGVSVSFPNLLLSGGALSGRGTLTIPANDFATLSSGTISGGLSFVNHGTTTEAAVATIDSIDASVISNYGTLTLADNALVQNPPCCGTTSGWIVNESGAQISYTGSASSSSTEIRVPFDNFGTVTTNRGTLNLTGGSSSESLFGDSGTYNTAGVGILVFGDNGNRANRILGPTTSFVGLGQVTNQGQLTVNSGTTISIPNVLASGTLAGSGTFVIPSGDSGTLSDVTLADGVTLTNSGSLTVATNTSVSFFGPSTLKNGGTVALSDNDNLNDVCFPACEGAIINQSGTQLSYTGSASNSTTKIDVAFDNFGSATVTRGTLFIAAGSSSSSAGDSGTYNVASTAFLTFNGGVRRIAGSARFPGSGQVTDSADLSFLGSLSLPNFVFQGTLEAGAGAVVTATLHTAPSGALQLDADRPGHFGEFVSTGALNVTGLDLELSNPSFQLPCGSPITAVHASSLSGPFAFSTDSNPPPGGSLVESDTATTAKFVESCPVASVPQEQTYGTGRFFDAANPSGYFAEPVNTGTGAYSTQQTDARLGGLGVPFSFTRYYSSDNTATGRFSTGWTDTFTPSLQVSGSTVTLTSENGQQSTFQQQSDGSYLGAPGVYSQLTQSGSGWSLTRKDRAELTFNSTGQLVSETDLNGIGLLLTYNGSGQLASVKDNAGRTVSFAYTTGGQLASISFPTSRTVKYAYNASHQLASVTDAANDVTKYTYDASGLLSTITDGNLNKVVTNTYNGSGQVTQQVNADGKISSFSYNGSGVTTFTDARGHKWTDTYNGFALISRTDPLGNTTSYSYDNNLDISAVTSPNGNTTVMQYDSAGNVLTRTAPAPFGYFESWAYNSFSEPLSYTDGRSLTTSYSYDARGNLLQVTAPDGSAIKHTYDATTGALTSSTTASNFTTMFGHDPAGNLNKQTSPLNEVTTMTYDGAGRLMSKVSPRGNVSGGNPANFTTTYTYDADDRLLTTTDPLGHVSKATYDNVGNVKTRTDPKALTTTYTYDAANQLQKILAADSTTANTTTYDAVGNVASRTNGNGKTTNYTYDFANRLLSATNPVPATTTYSYDPDSNLTKVVGPNSASTSYTYDQLDRRTGISYSDGTHSVAYTYDADSNVVTMSDAVGTTHYAYDSVQNLKTTQVGFGVYSYSYTADREVSSRTYPDGLQQTALYDGDQHLKSVTSSSATTGYSYDPDGNLTTTTLPSSSNTTETRSYDNADQLKSISAATGTTTLDNYVVTRDADGNPTALTTPSGPISYTYDSLGRIKQACYGTSCVTNKITYAYDADGNIKTETTGSGTPTTTTNTFNAGDELTQSVTGTTTTSLTYDADGREKTSGSTSYSWNQANELTSTVKAGVTTTFIYDGNGNRVSSTTGTTKTTESWDINAPLPQLASLGNQNYLWGVGSLGFTTPSGTFYDLHDDQGSTVGVISSTGVQQSKASYDPFGNTISSTNLVSGAPTQQIAWQAQVQDSSGQYDLRAREYDPATARFLSVDPSAPAVEVLTMSPYQYANDQPTVGSDPSGLCWGGFLGGNCSKVVNVVEAAVGLGLSVVGVACEVSSLGIATPVCVGVGLAGVALGVQGLYGAATQSNQTSYSTSYSHSAYYSGYISGYGNRAAAK